MPDPQLGHVRSSSPTRNQTWILCFGSMESWPLDHKGSPIWEFFEFTMELNFYTTALSKFSSFIFSLLSSWSPSSLPFTEDLLYQRQTARVSRILLILLHLILTALSGITLYPILIFFFFFFFFFFFLQRKKLVNSIICLSYQQGNTRCLTKILVL